MENNTTKPVSQVPVVPSPKVQSPVENPAPQSTNKTPSAYERFYSKKGSGGGLKVLKIIAIVLVGILIVLGLVFLFAKYSKKVKVFGKKGEVVWWNIWLDDQVAASLIQDYEKENPNVKINYIKQSPQDYRERLASSLFKGTGPDIFSFHNSWTSTLKTDLDPVPDSFLKPAEYAQTYYPGVASDMKIDQGYLGVPLNYDALTLFVNDDIFASAGKVPPKTWDQLRQTAKELTTVGADKFIIQSGVALGITDNVDYWPEILALMLYQNSADPAKPSGQYANYALEYYVIFSLTDKVWDKTLPQSTIAFSQGKLAMFFAPSRVANDLKKVNPHLNFRTIPLPQLRRDDPAELPVSYSTYWAEGVWQKSTNRDLAWKFLKFLSSKETLQKINEGARQKGLVGYASPRVDMSSMFVNDNILGSVVSLAPYAKSWYLAQKTYDGPNGINTSIAKPFEKTIISMNGDNPVISAAKTLPAEVSQVLLKFSLISPQQP